jgi:hypothetical protein
MSAFHDKLISKFASLDHAGIPYTVKFHLRSGVQMELALADYSPEFISGETTDPTGVIQGHYAVVRFDDVVLAEILE